MSNSSTSLEITSPGGGAPLGEVELTPVGQVSAIVGAACKAQPEWSRRTVADRAALLEVAADLLDPQSDLIWFAELVVDLREGTPNEGPLIRLREIRC